MRESYEEEVENRLKDQAKRKAFKEHAAELRHDTRKHGVKFWDSKGKGRIVSGKKFYNV